MAGAAGGALLFAHPEEDGGISGVQPAGNPELLVGVFLASLDSQQQGIELAKSGLAGVDLDGATGVLHRQIQTFLDQEQESQAIVDPLVAVPEPVGLLKVTDCPGKPALLQIGLPQAAVGFGVQRLQRQDPLEVLLGFVRFPGFDQEQAEGKEQTGFAGVPP